MRRVARSAFVVERLSRSVLCCGFYELWIDLTDGFDQFRTLRLRRHRFEHSPRMNAGFQLAGKEEFDVATEEVLGGRVREE